MNDDIRRLQDTLQRQRQEIERSASLLKNTQPRLFSGSDGSFKSPNKRFSFGSPTSDIELPPFSIVTRTAGIGVSAGTINGIIPTNLFSFGTKNKNCTIICEGNSQNGVITSAKLIEGPTIGKPQIYTMGSAPSSIYATLVRIENGSAFRTVQGSIDARPIFVSGMLKYPPEYSYSWTYSS
jgi:hypothetical protein